MANQENVSSSRGKLLVDLARKQEKRCANSDIHEGRYFRPYHSNLKKGTEKYVQEEIKATKPEMVPEKAPLPSSDEKGQGDCKAMEKEILAPQPVSARSMPSFENVNNFPQQETALKECLDIHGGQSQHSESSITQIREEFELVPSNQENIFILKPIKNSSSLEKEVSQHSTLDEEDDLFANMNCTDVSLNIEQVISEVIKMDDENIGMETNLDVQEDFNNELIVESNDFENPVNVENQTSNTIPNVEQENILENEILSYKPKNCGETNAPAQDITNENSEQIDVEQGSLDENSLEENVSGGTISEENPRKRKRNKKPMKHLWTSVKNKEKRMKGEDYLGRRKNDAGKNVFDVKRNKRQQKPRCPCIAKRNSVFKCYQFTEERRQKVFTDFWQLDWKERKILVKQLVDKRLISHRRTNSLEFRRKGSLFYHLSIDDNAERLRVCKKMFLNTLNLGEWAVSNWISNSSESQEGDQPEEEIDRDSSAEVEQNTSILSSNNNQNGQKDKSNRMTILREFFDRLPKLESHYCRKSTQKMYLEPNWQSKAELYRHYRSYCQSEGKENYTASDCSFYTVFDELNLGLFSPKKDQCDLCCSFNKGNLAQEEYDAHIIKKNLARSEKDRDKENSDERTAVFTMDMQAVLLSPSLKASALYYKTKLKVHNYTIFNLKTSDAVCYIWNESEGGLDADEFSSIITHFIINEVDRSKTDSVILYSDGCTYQNRNSILSNALLFTANKTGLKITQKFLEKGHSQMECDSMHSLIERKLRNREIYSPAGYVEVCRTARANPSPYKVNYLDHTFFRKYNQLKFVPSIRPGKKKGDPVVTNLRVLEYKPEGTVKVKINFCDEFSDLPWRIRVPPYEVSLPSLHKKPLPIKFRLFKDLQDLKSVLPKDVHGYYDSLSHYKKDSKGVCGEDSSCCSCV